MAQHPTTAHPSFLGAATSQHTATLSGDVRFSPKGTSTKQIGAVRTGGNNAKAGTREISRLRCPHCESFCTIRSSQQMTKLTREATFRCENDECGHTFVALTEVVRTLSPSSTPDPSVSLPISTHVRRELLRAQLDSASAAPHTTQFTQPVTGDLFAGGAPTD